MLVGPFLVGASECPPEWVAERLQEYIEDGCDGFVVNLEYDRPGLNERVLEFGERVARPLRAENGYSD